MTTFFKLSLLLFLMGSSFSAFSAVYKCEENGNILFSDKPCKRSAQDITGKKLNTLPKKATPSGSSRSEITKKLVDDMESSRIKRKTIRDITSLEKQISKKRASLSAEMLELKDQQQYADDEFPDDEYEANQLKKSYDVKMTALEKRYSAEITELKEKISELNKQLGDDKQ